MRVSGEVDENKEKTTLKIFHTANVRKAPSLFVVILANIVVILGNNKSVRMSSR